MEALDRVRLQHGAAGLEQPVHCLNAEPAQEALVATVVLLSPLREVAEPPVVYRPEGIAPAGRPAPTGELPGHRVGHVEVDAVAAIARRVADSDETGSDQVLHGLGRNLSELLGPRGAFLQHRY